MQISAKQIEGSKVFDSNGKPIGKVMRCLIDVANGNILAFEMRTKGAKYISPQDVISWKGNNLILGQEYEIHDSDDLIRLKELLKSRKQGILGKKIITESGTKLGIATDYHINSRYFLLSTITAEKNFLGFFHFDSKLIHQKSIIEITRGKIIVQDAWEKVNASQSYRRKFDLQNAATLDQALSVPEDQTYV